MKEEKGGKTRLCLKSKVPKINSDFFRKKNFLAVSIKQKRESSGDFFTSFKEQKKESQDFFSFSHTEKGGEGSK